MPLATELLPLLSQRLEVAEMQEWLDGLRDRLAWLAGCDEKAGESSLNIEQVFHIAHFDIEAHRLRQHLAPVGRWDGPGTPWNAAESIVAWLSHLEDALRDVILQTDVAGALVAYSGLIRRGKDPAPFAGRLALVAVLKVLAGQ